MGEDRTVVVTGGGKGIGEAISRMFYARGYHVVIGSREDGGLAGEFGERGLYHSTDVREPVELQELLQVAERWNGRVDVMINNAGYSQWKSIGDIEEDFWNRMIDTNLKGTFFGCKAAAEVLPDGGSIINISSLAGKRGSANNSAYCASKFGVNGITQALAKELGGRSIRVNAVCPVYVRTEGLLEALEADEAPPGGEDVEMYLNNFAQSNSALGVLPTGAEIGRVCVFLASSEASAITGQCINVDCGVLPQ